MNTFLTDRERQILDMLVDNYNLTVSRISSDLNVSAVTVRSDLSSMEEKGFIVRTRGGAFPVFHPEILIGQKRHIEKKIRIAKAAASIIEEGDTVMINSGTTSSLVAKYLLGKRNISIVTNSTLLLSYARINPSIKLTLVGGEFRPAQESLIGPQALRHIEDYHVKYAFVGTDGFSLEKGMTTHLADGAEIIKAMAHQADKIILIADSSKYGKSGFVKILPLDVVDMIICDTDLDDAHVETLRDTGLEVLLV